MSEPVVVASMASHRVSKEFGYFGKYPGYSDFVQNGLSTSELKFWQAWINSYMDAGQSHYKDQWQDVYLQSPVWRFYVYEPSLGDRGNHAWLGAMMPSVDKRGRFFPLLVLSSIERAAPFSLLRAHQPVLDKLEARLVDCLNEPFIAPQELAAQFSIQTEPVCNSISDSEVAAELDSQNSLLSDADALLSVDSMFQRVPRAISVWQVVNAANGCQQLEAYSGLPDGSDFAALQITTVSEVDPSVTRGEAE